LKTHNGKLSNILMKKCAKNSEFRQKETCRFLGSFDLQLKRYIEEVFGSNIKYESENIFKYNNDTYYLGTIKNEDKEKDISQLIIKEPFY